jgi:AcrR family transcriptional regulator
MVRDLDRNDWLKAARMALLKGGVEAVRVEKLARKLHVTKGSFYWHFRDRDELLDLLLREWEGEVAEIIPRLGRNSARETLLTLVRLVEERAHLSEMGEVPSDAAIFAWATVSPKVARRVNRAEQERIKLLRRVTRQSGRTELLYLAWLGFVARGRRVPELRDRFRQIARSMLKLLLPPESKGKQTTPTRSRPARATKPPGIRKRGDWRQRWGDSCVPGRCGARRVG